MTVVVGQQTEVLDVDDAISFASDVAHSYANEGTEPARFSLAVFEPGVGGVGPQPGRDSVDVEGVLLAHRAGSGHLDGHDRASSRAAWCRMTLSYAARSAHLRK